MGPDKGWLEKHKIVLKGKYNFHFLQIHLKKKLKLQEDISEINSTSCYFILGNNYFSPTSPSLSPSLLLNLFLLVTASITPIHLFICFVVLWS